MMQVERLSVAPVSALFNWSEVALFLRLGDTSYEQDAVLRLLDGAAFEFEKYAGIALLNQQVRVKLDGWTDLEWFPLPISPLFDSFPITVTIDGATTTPTAIAYGLRPGIRFTDAPAKAAIEITYTAGFGAAVEDIPKDIRTALLDQTSVQFDERGWADRKGNGMSAHMARIAARYRRVGL